MYVHTDTLTKGHNHSFIGTHIYVYTYEAMGVPKKKNILPDRSASLAVLISRIGKLGIRKKNRNRK
jgi:hypothetical protein